MSRCSWDIQAAVYAVRGLEDKYRRERGRNVVAPATGTGWVGASTRGDAGSAGSTSSDVWTAPPCIGEGAPATAPPGPERVMDAPGTIGEAAGRRIVPASSGSSICVSASCVSAISRRTSRGAARG